jgi:UDP-glucose 4-epimerase
MRETKEMMILGHSGFVGSHLEAALSKNDAWTVTGRSLPSVDLTIPDHVSRLASFFKSDSTLVLAAAVKRQFGDTLDAYRQNTAIVENVCTLLERHPIKRVIFMSSSAVYGEETENMNISESTPVNPTSYYGISKYTAERLLHKACVANKKTSLICLRPPLVYGPADQGKTYGPSGFSAAALEGAPITLWGDGTELREFIFIDDLCRVIAHLAESDFSGELNVVSGIAYSFADVIAVLKEKLPNLVVNTRVRSKQKANNAFDASKMKSLTPVDFQFTSLKVGISRILSQI